MPGEQRETDEEEQPDGDDAQPEVERGVAGLDQAEPTAVRVFTRSVVGALEVA